MKRVLAILIPVVIIGGLIGWRLNAKKQEAKLQTEQAAARKKTPPNVTVAPVVTRDIVNTFEGVGSIEAPLNVKISPKITGRLDAVNVQIGDRVRAGQVLAHIDPSELQATLRQKQADLAQSRYRLAQARLTQDPTNVGVVTSIRQQQANVTSAQADENQTRQNYNAQVATAQAAVTDAQGKVENAQAAVANAKAAITGAKANLNNAQTKYNRINELYKQGFIAAQDVDDARTTLDVQKSGVEVAQGQLNAAQAQLDSAQAQKQSAQQQAGIVAIKGKADIIAAAAKTKQADAGLQLAQANTAQRPAYRANLEALQAAVASAEADVHNAQAQLSENTLLSPIDGYITSRTLDPGAIATPGQAFLNVQQIRSVWFTVPIPEEVNRHIFVGRQAQVALDALPGQTLTGRIVQINPSADPQSRQFQVRVQLANANQNIKPGMFGRATFETLRVRNAIVVPREAVQTGKDGQATVMVVDAEGVIHVRPVTQGASDTAGIAITQGVQPGDQVITLSNVPLKDGQKVRVTAPPPAGQTGNQA